MNRYQLIKWIASRFSALSVSLILHIALAFYLFYTWNPTIKKVPMPATELTLTLSPIFETTGGKAQKQQEASQQNSTPTETVEETPPAPPKITTPSVEPLVAKPKVEPKPKPKKIVKKQPIKKPIVKSKPSVKQTQSSTPTEHSEATTPGISQGVLSNRNAAPAYGDPSQIRKAKATWQSLLLSHIKRHKKYPRQAQFKKQQGIIKVHFTLNAQGYVIQTRLVKGSNYPLLDDEALALFKRANPFPKPPAEVMQGKQSISLVVPISFTLKERRW